MSEMPAFHARHYWHLSKLAARDAIRGAGADTLPMSAWRFSAIAIALAAMLSYIIVYEGWRVFVILSGWFHSAPFPPPPVHDALSPPVHARRQKCSCRQQMSDAFCASDDVKKKKKKKLKITPINSLMSLRCSSFDFPHRSIFIYSISSIDIFVHFDIFIITHFSFSRLLFYFRFSFGSPFACPHRRLPYARQILVSPFDRPAIRLFRFQLSYLFSFAHLPIISIFVHCHFRHYRLRHFAVSPLPVQRPPSLACSFSGLKIIWSFSCRCLFHSPAASFRRRHFLQAALDISLIRTLLAERSDYIELLTLLISLLLLYFRRIFQQIFSAFFDTFLLFDDLG